MPKNLVLNLINGKRGLADSLVKNLKSLIISFIYSSLCFVTFNEMPNLGLLAPSDQFWLSSKDEISTALLHRILYNGFSSFRRVQFRRIWLTRILIKSKRENINVKIKAKDVFPSPKIANSLDARSGFL